MGVGRALCTTFRRFRAGFGAGLFLNIAPGKDCLLQRVTTRGPASDAPSKGQCSEPLGQEGLLLLLLLFLLLLPLVLLLLLLLLLLPIRHPRVNAKATGGGRGLAP